MIDIILTPLTPDVIERVATLESLAGDAHWSRAQFEKELHLLMSRFFVLRMGPDILGYGGYWKVGEEAQVTNLAIDPHYRQSGRGHDLLTSLLERAREEGCRFATLEVRSGNSAAQALYRKAGFLTQGRRPHAYTEPVEDALLMTKKL